MSARIFAFPNHIVTFNDNGRVGYFRDNFPSGGGTAASHGTFPPNLTAPSTFIDGSERMSGDVDGFVLVYDFATNQGSLADDVTLDAGPDLIYVPPGQRAGWVLRLLGQTNPTIPAGYDHQAHGECVLTGTPIAHRTWGALKALYRWPCRGRAIHPRARPLHGELCSDSWSATLYGHGSRQHGPKASGHVMSRVRAAPTGPADDRVVP